MEAFEIGWEYMKVSARRDKFRLNSLSSRYALEIDCDIQPPPTQKLVVIDWTLCA